MSKRSVFFAALVAAALSAPNVYADMGHITVSTAGATVKEGAQKAIILYNDNHEVLILGTELKAARKTPIIRFIPFPSEPTVKLAPKGTFDQLAAIVAKYQLRYVYTSISKGGPPSVQARGVEVRLAAKLGAHDVTVIKVNDVSVFRSWVNRYFRRHRLPGRASYPAAERIVRDYVAQGFKYFAIDSVDVTSTNNFVVPIAYTFRSKSLYYPLETSNTFGGKGEIELFVISHRTLCAPGSNTFRDDFDLTADAQGHARYGDQCLGIPVKTSTSALLVPEEHDLKTLYPGGRAFFGKAPVYIQTMRYKGPFIFHKDIDVAMPAGFAGALGVERPAPFSLNRFEPMSGPDMPACREKPARGPCKGLFRKFYYDRASHSCKTFVWGGCQGSVPFETLKECRDMCGITQAK